MGRKKKKHTPKSSDKSHTIKTPSVGRDSLVKKWLKPEIILIGVFILALFIRLLYLNQIISNPIFYGLAMDSEKYGNFALQILKGNLTHKDFIYLNPFYPFFLALIYLIFGHSNLSVVCIQGIIDSLSCVLIYYIASRLFNKRVGILAALIYACYGIAIFYTGILLAPTLVIFFILLFIASLIFGEEKRRIIIFFISGILFGLAALARPNVILFLFFLPLWFFTVLTNKLGIRRALKGFLFLLVGLLMVTSLITIRNYSIEKRFSPFSVQGGINFYIGNNPKATGRFMSPHGVSRSPIEQVKTSIRNAERESGKKLTPSQASRYWLFKGLKFIKDNPHDALSLYMKKFALFWRKEEIVLNIDYLLSKTLVPIFQLPFISFGIIAPFAILGIILSLKRIRTTLMVTLFIFSYMVSVITFFVSARYRLPIVPFLIIYSSYTLYRFLEMIRAKEVKGITILGALFILLFVGINKNFACFKFVSISHYNNLGIAFNRMDRLDDAISEYKKALTINPHHAGIHNNLGAAYNGKDMPDEAISEYKKALTINPNFAEAHNNLGNVYSKKGRLDDAISEYKKALAINPNYASAHHNLGNMYLEKGVLDEAMFMFKKAIAINPHFAEAHNNLAVAYYYKGNYTLAIIHCDKAIGLGFRTHPQFLKQLELYR